MSNDVIVKPVKILEGEIIKRAPLSVEFSHGVNKKTPPIPGHSDSWVRRALRGADDPLIIDHETGEPVDNRVTAGDIFYPKAL